MPRDLVTATEIADTQSFADAARRYFRMPGIVRAFYPGTFNGPPASVDVQPAVHDVRFDTTTGERYSEPWPVLLKIPVRYPSGNGYAIWWDLKVGDKVDLEGFDLDPGPYLKTAQPQDPALTRRNGGAHWVAVPGDYTDLGGLPPSEGQIMIGIPSSTIIAISNGTIKLGSDGPSDSVATANKVDPIFSALNTFLGVLNTWGGEVGTLLGLVGAPPAHQAAFISAIGTLQMAITPTGSNSVKCTD
jgi:hypothetical protein